MKTKENNGVRKQQKSGIASEASAQVTMFPGLCPETKANQNLTKIQESSWEKGRAKSSLLQGGPRVIPVQSVQII